MGASRFGCKQNVSKNMSVGFIWQIFEGNSWINVKICTISAKNRERYGKNEIVN